MWLNSDIHPLNLGADLGEPASDGDSSEESLNIRPGPSHQNFRWVGLSRSTDPLDYPDAPTAQETDWARLAVNHLGLDIEQVLTEVAEAGRPILKCPDKLEDLLDRKPLATQDLTEHYLNVWFADPDVTSNVRRADVAAGRLANYKHVTQDATGGRITSDDPDLEGGHLSRLLELVESHEAKLAKRMPATDPRFMAELQASCKADPDFHSRMRDFSGEDIYEYRFEGPRLPWLFRRTLPVQEYQLKDVRFDACLVIALNNLCGCRVFSTMFQVFSLLARNESPTTENYTKKGQKVTVYPNMYDFALRRGLPLDERAFLLPYYRDGVLYPLGIRQVYEFTQEQIAVLHWDVQALNFLLSSAARTSHILLRLDRTRYGGDLTYNSHMVACRWNVIHCCWEARESDDPWFLFRARAGARASYEAWELFKNCRRVSVYELYCTEQHTTATSTGISELAAQARKPHGAHGVRYWGNVKAKAAKKKKKGRGLSSSRDQKRSTATSGSLQSSL